MSQGTRSQHISPSGKRARFSKEFKVEAVRLLALGQKPATQLDLFSRRIIGWAMGQAG